MSKLSTEIAELLNKHSRENASNTPDFILAEYLMVCLEAFEQAVCRRDSWYGRTPPDAEVPVEAPEDEARPKLKKPKLLPGIPCPDCGGSGKVTEAGNMIECRCPRCGGTGEIM